MDAPGPEPVDWAFAAQVARRFAGKDVMAGSYLSSSLVPDFEEATARAEDLVSELTGLRVPDGARARARVVDRERWIGANLDSFRRLLGPVTARLRERMGPGPVGFVTRRAAGLEMGALLGLVSHRVLGQYDLLLADVGVPPHAAGDPAAGELDGESTALDGDVIYYVGSNVLAIERRFDFRPRDFRLWLALHEVTHRAQFTGVPWLQEHFSSLVRKSLELSDPDPARLAAALRHAVDEVRRGRSPIGDAGLLSLFATPEQRALLDEIQALMSLLEGHGNVVMDRLGRVHVAGQERMSRTLSTRRKSGGLTRPLQKLAGLELKMRQYEIGERFVTAVSDEAGFEAIDAAWRGPECLPTLAELSEPSLWLERVGVSRASV